MKKVTRIFGIGILSLVVLYMSAIAFVLHRYVDALGPSVLFGLATHERESRIPTFATIFYLEHIAHFDLNQAAPGTTLGLALTVCDDPNDPCTEAGRKRALDLADFLISRGADVNAISVTTGMAALHIAILGPHPDAVKYLLQKGADVNLKIRPPQKKLAGATPLVFTEFLIQKNPKRRAAYEEIKNILLQAGAKR